MESNLSGIHESDCGAVFLQLAAEKTRRLDAPSALAPRMQGVDGQRTRYLLVIYTVQ